MYITAMYMYMYINIHVHTCHCIGRLSSEATWKQQQQQLQERRCPRLDALSPLPPKREQSSGHLRQAAGAWALRTRRLRQAVGRRHRQFSGRRHLLDCVIGRVSRQAAVPDDSEAARRRHH